MKHLHRPLGIALTVIVTASLAGGPAPARAGGALFGLAVQPGNKGVYFVDDDLNTLELFH